MCIRDREKAIQNNETDTKTITENAYSALFVYNQIRGGQSNCQSLSNMSEALELLKTKGNCLAREFDFNVEDCYARADNAIKERTRNNTVADYSRLFDKNTEGDTKVALIRELLALHKPVAIGLKINNYFMSL